jgi:hypothetical protein
MSCALREEKTHSTFLSQKRPSIISVKTLGAPSRQQSTRTAGFYIPCLHVRVLTLLARLHRQGWTTGFRLLSGTLIFLFAIYPTSYPKLFSLLGPVQPSNYWIRRPTLSRVEVAETLGWALSFIRKLHLHSCLIMFYVNALLRMGITVSSLADTFYFTRSTDVRYIHINELFISLFDFGRKIYSWLKGLQAKTRRKWEENIKGRPKLEELCSWIRTKNCRNLWSRKRNVRSCNKKSQIIYCYFIQRYLVNCEVKQGRIKLTMLYILSSYSSSTGKRPVLSRVWIQWLELRAIDSTSLCC